MEGAREALVTAEEAKEGLGARVEKVAAVEADTGLAGARELLMSLRLTLTTGPGVLGLLVCCTVV